MSNTLYVTPAQVLAAKLVVELSEEDGEEPDEALKAIANAQVVTEEQTAAAATKRVEVAEPPDIAQNAAYMGYVAVSGHQLASAEGGSPRAFFWVEGIDPDHVVNVIQQISEEREASTNPRDPSWARRRDLRAAIFAVLAEQPMNGYQIIQEIATRSGGAWKPSPGSVYPTLQALEDEGLVGVEADGGGRTYTLTNAGRAYVTRQTEKASASWEAISGASESSTAERRAQSE
jgi:DNA-binding PadR family transcriptional regulator